MSVIAVEIAKHGQVTIPKSLRERYSIRAGQRFTLIDLGGAFLLSPRVSKVNGLADGLRDETLATGTSLEQMLTELRSRRESSMEDEPGI